MFTPINKALAGARTKLAEAQFFLSLMDRTEQNHQVLVEGNDVAEEYAFLLAALLNACYSVASYLKESDMPLRDLAQKFLTEHAEYYARGTGRRSIAVHLRPVTPAHHGYIPPPGDNVILRFSEKYMEQRGDNIRLDFVGRYYYEKSMPQNAIGDLFAVHLTALYKLIDDCEKAGAYASR